MEKVVHKYKLGEEPKDYEYWLTQSPSKRLEAIEYFRQQYHTEDEINKRMVKVWRVIKLSDDK